MILDALRWPLILSAAMVSTASAQIVGANPDSIPKYGPATSYLRHFDEGARAARLSPLRETALPPGEREVRIWTMIEISASAELYRLTERRGVVRGELIDTWDTPSSESVYWRKGRCDDFGATDGAGACRVRFVQEPPWARVLRTAEAHGLWSIPDPSTLPLPKHDFRDGWTMAVELRDGPRYRTYLYSNPGLNGWPSDKQVSEIRLALFAVDSLARMPEVFKVYHGLTTGLYHSAFRSCDGDGAWEFYDDLRSLVGRASPAVRAAAPRHLSDYSAPIHDNRLEELLALQLPNDSSTVYEVELVGALSPESDARSAHSKFPRLLEPSELRSVRVARRFSVCAIRHRL